MLVPVWGRGRAWRTTREESSTSLAGLQDHGLQDAVQAPRRPRTAGDAKQCQDNAVGVSTQATRATPATRAVQSDQANLGSILKYYGIWPRIGAETCCTAPAR